MTLVEYLQSRNLPMMGLAKAAPDSEGLDNVGQFLLGDIYVIQLMNGNSVTIPDLNVMLDIICDELRAAPYYDVEVFVGAGNTNRKTLFVHPRRELGRPFGRNLRRLRENLTRWMVTYSLSGEMPDEIPRGNRPQRKTPAKQGAISWT